MKKLSETTSEKLLITKKMLLGIAGGGSFAAVIFIIITFVTGYGSFKYPLFMLSICVFCYFGVTKIDKELKSREIN